MIALVTVILALLKVVGLELSWWLVLTPLFIEIIYWFLEYIEYDSKMVDIIMKKSKSMKKTNKKQKREDSKAFDLNNVDFKRFITAGTTETYITIDNNERK